MKNTILIILCIVYLLNLVSCREKVQPVQRPLMKALFRQDWKEMAEEHRVPIFVHDTSGKYLSDYYRTVTPLYTLKEYKVLENYVWNTTNENSIILRVINEFSTRGFLDRDSTIEPDNSYWIQRVPFLLTEFCWIVRSTPDSDTLRYIYLKDNDTAKIMDRSIYDKAEGSRITQMIDYVLDSTDTNTGRSELYPRSTYRPFSTVVSMWSKRQSFHVTYGNLWYYTDCGHEELWEVKSDVDINLIQKLLQFLCSLHNMGCLENTYGYKSASSGSQ
jgi:hypothetical protein